mmetsp:Transcript_39087/g.59599  ORF Transcript_39087/g.59599 Transcript_39087/m.59599 type:complete len:106 (-) Transcript_39087:7340-7657(-)
MAKLQNPTSQQLRHKYIHLEGFIDFIRALYVDILKRVPSITESARRGKAMVSNFKLGSICIVQNFLPRRIDGLKLINNACHQCLQILKWAPSPHATEKVDDVRIT